MRLILFGIFGAVFVILPFYLLNTMVMPELNSMQQFYAHEGQIVSKVAESAQQNGQ